MKAKTINAVICKKIDAWLNSIEDAQLRAQVAPNVIVTGGCIASMLLNEKVNDFDVYFRTRDVALAVANYYVGKFKAAKPGEREHIKVKADENRIAIFVQSMGAAGEDDEGNAFASANNLSDEELKEIATLVEDGEDSRVKEEQEKEKRPRYRPVFLSRNAISLSDDIQLVIRFWGAPDQIHDTYDFIHACNYWDSQSRRVTLRPEAMEALLARELRYRGSKYPLCSLFRMKKFIQRGWHVNCGTILRICWNLKDYDLTDVGTLEEQLTGVDVSFFISIIESMRQWNKEHHPEDAERVDGEYLMELIDKMF